MPSESEKLGDVEYKWISPAEFKVIFEANEKRAFPSDRTYRPHVLFSDQEKENVKLLGKNAEQFIELALVAYAAGELVGWTWGRQLDGERYYMINSAVFPEFQGNGVYKTLLQMVLHKTAQLGFQRVDSLHHPSNNPILIAKLKAGFAISGLELSDTFGFLVRLAYFHNPKRKELFDSRSGYRKLSKELSDLYPQNRS